MMRIKQGRRTWQVIVPHTQYIIYVCVSVYVCVWIMYAFMHLFVYYKHTHTIKSRHHAQVDNFTNAVNMNQKVCENMSCDTCYEHTRRVCMHAERDTWNTHSHAKVYIDIHKWIHTKSKSSFARAFTEPTWGLCVRKRTNCLRTCIQSCMHAYVRTYIHTYIHTYVRTYVHSR